MDCFTLQLFFSQWFPRCSKWKLLKWTRHTKYTGFMDTYHAPFKRKHRYWIGLLLFALIVHNIIAAMATNNFLPILSMGCIACGLILLKFFYKRVFKVWSNDLIETTFIFNLIFLAFGTFYAQTAGTLVVISILANVSMALSVFLFLTIICVHSYKYIYLQSRVFRRHRANIKKMTARVKEGMRRGPKRQEMEELVH